MGKIPGAEEYRDDLIMSMKKIKEITDEGISEVKITSVTTFGNNFEMTKQICEITFRSTDKMINMGGGEAFSAREKRILMKKRIKMTDVIVI